MLKYWGNSNCFKKKKNPPSFTSVIAEKDSNTDLSDLTCTKNGREDLAD